MAKKVVTNDMIAEFLDTSDEWISQRTGIRTRHVISDEELENLAIQAARNALEMSGLKPSVHAARMVECRKMAGCVTRVALSSSSVPSNMMRVISNPRILSALSNSSRASVLLW